MAFFVTCILSIFYFAAGKQFQVAFALIGIVAVEVLVLLVAAWNTLIFGSLYAGSEAFTFSL